MKLQPKKQKQQKTYNNNDKYYSVTQCNNVPGFWVEFGVVSFIVPVTNTAVTSVADHGHSWPAEERFTTGRTIFIVKQRDTVPKPKQVIKIIY